MPPWIDQNREEQWKYKEQSAAIVNTAFIILQKYYMQHNFSQNSISHSFYVQEIIFQSVWPRAPADRGKGNRLKMNFVNIFVLVLRKKFSVNDIIHSEKLNKMNHNNSETQICSPHS